MSDNGFATMYIRDGIAKCEDLDELRETIFPILKSQQEQWAEKMQEILAETGCTRSRFAELCGVSRTTIEKWCKGSIPKSRETFLRIGMAAGYHEERMNQLLQRYGQYPALYAKSLEDCVCKFVIDHGDGTDMIGQYQLILGQIRQNIVRDDTAGPVELATTELDEKLSAIRDEEELERFIRENITVFATAYHRFYAYVKMCIDANYPLYAPSLYEMAEAQEWSSSLRQCVSAIRQKKWYPTRNKIISLGLHLSMDQEQIDEMLELAHMEPLCPKNLFESVIIFILEDASLNNILDAKAENYDPDELCRYAREVLNRLNMPEVDAFISELPEIDDAR